MSSDDERRDLLTALAQHRQFLHLTTQDLTDEQAAATPTASALSLGGLIKHVAAAEETWADFIVRGAAAFFNRAAPESWMDGFRMLEGETLAGLLERYDEVAARTEEVVGNLPDLNVSHPLPEAPWFEPGATWSARRALLHILAETAQHAGHADIIRETLDGAKTMG